MRNTNRRKVFFHFLRLWLKLIGQSIQQAVHTDLADTIICNNASTKNVIKSVKSGKWTDSVGELSWENSELF